MIGEHSKNILLPDRYRSLANKKIVVTGAAGFIGGALFRRLVSYGLDATATVLYQHEADALRKEGHTAHVLDLLSDEPWDDLLQDIDIVFHIAAMFQEVEHGRTAYEKANCAGALRLAQTAERAGVRRFVHCSTIGVHGAVKEIPATEQTPFNPMDEYHETKLAGELAIIEFAKTLSAQKLVVTVNRPAMVYGPGDMRMLKLFKAIAANKFFMIGSGKTLAHLGYIDDQVESFLLCAVAPAENVHCEAFNIASGRPITLNAFVSYISQNLGVNIPSFHIPVAPVWFAGLLCELLFKPLGKKPPIFRRRVGFFTHNRAFDCTKAKKLLGYESAWPEEKGIAETVKWYKENGYI